MFRTILALSLIATTATADEVWTSTTGDVIYEDEKAGAAIFSFITETGTRAELVIPGLAGNYDNRGVHGALWIGTGPDQCAVSMMRPEGQPSMDWGTAVISFDRPAFPTGFTLTIGDCIGPLTRSMRAELN
ncbi:hypothetical protein [uncultured Pelagimonas sp.]|uniref:hypothetical protein n=1 Tax=uncultured Pelagimonas sp. TaxID=1618102 RepID=UPI0026271E2C|nr:hypothetical protein [uncultured Pelagimonas sp.]